MGEKLDDMKGRAKEAAGDLTDDPDLKQEGKEDRLGAKVKGVADKAADKVHEVVDDLKR